MKNVQISAKLSNVKTTENMNVVQLVSDRYKQQSCHSDCEQNKNDDLKRTADTDFLVFFKFFALKKKTYKFSSFKSHKIPQKSFLVGMLQLGPSICYTCRCRCWFLPASVEAAQESAPYSSSLAKHSGPG